MTKSMVARHREIRRMRECAAKEGKLARFAEQMGTLFADETVSLTDFSVRHMFEALVEDGAQVVNLHFNNSNGGFRMMEADSVNTSLFANIMGQWLYNAVLRAYMMPELIGDRLVRKIQSVERTERIPGVKAIGDQVEIIDEGKPYPRAVTSERWIETPPTIKRGLMVDITKETVFFDKTGLVLNECSGIGKYIAINRERRILDVVLGISTVYRRNGSAAIATYGSDNTKTSNALVDWTSVDASEQKFAAMTDPDTGEPIVVTPKQVIVPPALKNTGKRVKNATMTGVTTSSRETRVDGNSVENDFELLCNQYVKERTSSDTSWFHGDFQEGFVYMENWPLTVESESNGAMMFDRDIVQRYKASERGAAGVTERLVGCKNTA